MSVTRVGPVFVNKFLENFKNNSNLSLNLIEDELLKQLSDEQIYQFNSEDYELRENIEKLYKNNTSFITIFSGNYPFLLKNGLKQNYPPILSCQGNINLLKKQNVGFCGSRKASEKGLSVVIDCVEQLLANNIVVTSGNAAGIDQATHVTALKNRGYTIIVLPEGMLNFKIKKELKNVWDWERVLVLSEFQPNAIWSAGRAMQRNNSIIGISSAMILIEAALNGGSMDAGKKTLRMGRKLFAPVYEGMPSFAVGNQILLKEGATPIYKSNITGKANIQNIFKSLIDDLNNKNENLVQLEIFK